MAPGDKSGGFVFGLIDKRLPKVLGYVDFNCSKVLAWQATGML